MTAQNLKTDLAIVGGGGAGMAAALAAAEKGCRDIIVLEKTGSTAGSTAMAHDIFGAESPAQRRAGVDAGRDSLFRTAMDWAHWTNINPRLVRAFIDRSGDTIGWLEGKGIEFAVAQFYHGQVPWVRHYIVNGQGAQLMKVLRRESEKLGVKILTHTRGRRILRGKSGEVTGVAAEGRDGEVNVAAKSVIITTGGYGNNPDMLKKYCAYYHENMSYDGPAGNTGDGITMASEAGVALAGLGALNLHGPFLTRRESPGVAVDARGADGQPFKVRVQEIGWEPFTIWVNKNGRRLSTKATPRPSSPSVTSSPSSRKGSASPFSIARRSAWWKSRAFPDRHFRRPYTAWLRPAGDTPARPGKGDKEAGGERGEPEDFRLLGRDSRLDRRRAGSPQGDGGRV